jgi:hypothetical protein
MEQQGYAVVWPRSKKVKTEARLASRLNTLDHKTIGLLWDGIILGDEMFLVIEKELKKIYPQSKFIGYEVFGLTHGGDEAKTISTLPEKLRQYHCDAVISGIGC